MSELQKDGPKPEAEGTERSSHHLKAEGAKLHGDSQQPGLGKSRNEHSSSASATMEQNGQLGKIKVSDSSTNSGGTAPEKKQWTVAVDLGTTGPGTESSPLGAGVEPKLAYLKQLAKQTESKSVNFVVSAERPVDRKGELCHAEGRGARETAACDLNAAQKDLAKTERYFIHDGKIDKLPDEKSLSPAGELADLLKTATTLAPSEKIGLVIQSQQQGNNDGMVMNKAPLTMPQAVESIKKGLKGSDHSKLDVLDFDACSISNPGMLNAVKDVASNVVASSAIEKVTPAADGQNLQAAFLALLNNPSQSGRDFASAIVLQASAGANGLGEQNGTPNLASFDMQNYAGFKHDFDSFGAELNRAFHDKNLQSDIRKAVDATPVAPDGRSEDQSHIRDVKAFAENLLNTMKGKDPALQTSAANLLRSFDAMAVSQYGDRSQGQTNIGGLGVSLPGKEIVDKHEVGRIYSPLHQMEKTLRDSSGMRFEEKAALSRDLKQSIEALGMPKASETKALNDSVRKIESATGQDALNAAMKQMNSLLHQQESSAFGKKLATEFESGYLRAWQVHKEDSSPNLGQGWEQFYKQLDRPID